MFTRLSGYMFNGYLGQKHSAGGVTVNTSTEKGWIDGITADPLINFKTKSDELPSFSTKLDTVLSVDIKE